jgi:UDP-N-acetylglucosamine diphosphorylase/glucosamine-1-phosphate N-acetyltransferase
LDYVLMSTTAIILAAGKGTRMNSDLPKVLHPVCGRPMLAYVIDACRQAGCDKLILVVGHQAQMVRSTFAGCNGDITYVDQVPQMGTGHAVMVCQRELEKVDGPVLVVAGDGPLVRGETLRELLDTHRRKDAVCTLATSILPEPAKYGRIVRDAAGELLGIVEFLDASESQRQVREVNVSLYCFDAAALRQTLPKLTNNNAKGEYYITDALEMLRDAGGRLAAVAAVPPEDVLSINTIQELAEVDRIMAARLSDKGSCGSSGDSAKGGRK